MITCAVAQLTCAQLLRLLSDLKEIEVGRVVTCAALDPDGDPNMVSVQTTHSTFAGLFWGSVEEGCLSTRWKGVFQKPE